MISFTDNIKSVLNNDSIEYFSMVRIESSPGVNLYATTTYYNDIQLLPVSATYHYVADGTLLAADPPQNTSTVDREQYKVAFADPFNTKRGDIESSLVGKIIECRLGFVDPVTSQPFLNIEDTIVVYRGRVDGASISIKAGSLGESIVQITGSSPMRNLDMKKPYYISKERVHQRNPNDTSCDQIYEGSGALIVKWGRK